MYLVEGQLDCIKLWDLGIKNVVAVLGTGVSDKQRDLLTNNFHYVNIMLDNDEAGYDGTYGFYNTRNEYVEGIADKLMGLMRVRVVKYRAEDPGSLTSRKQIQGIFTFSPL